MPNEVGKNMLYCQYSIKDIMIRVNLAHIARKLGKTALEIAFETGINRNTINGLISGRKHDVKISTLNKICETYYIPLSSLIVDSQQTADINLQSYVVEEINDKPYIQEGEITPFTCWPFILDASENGIDFKKLRANLGPIECFFKGDYGYVYFREKSLNKYAELFYEKYRNSRSFEMVVNQFKIYSTQLNSLYIESQYLNSQSIERRKVLNYFHNLKKAYAGFWKFSLFIEAFDCGNDQKIIQQINQSLQLNANDIQALIQPTTYSFKEEREMALYEIIAKFSFTKAIPSQTKIVAFIDKYREELESYARAYDYHESNYANTSHLQLEDVIAQVTKLLQNPKQYLSKYQELREQTGILKEKQSNILKSHGLILNPFHFVQQISYLRNLRTQYNLMGIYALNFVLDWLVAQTSIAKEYLRYLSYDEVENLIKGLIPPHILTERYHNGIFISAADGNYRLYQGAEAKSLKKKLDSILKGEVQKSSTLSGVAASQGLVKSRARIVTKLAEIKKIQKGEIIVCSMIRPEYISYLEHAGGIVMQEGGLLSPGIVEARKLSIPALVSVRGILDRLNTGDLLEISTNSSSVKILKV